MRSLSRRFLLSISRRSGRYLIAHPVPCDLVESAGSGCVVATERYAVLARQYHWVSVVFLTPGAMGLMVLADLAHAALTGSSTVRAPWWFYALPPVFLAQGVLWIALASEFRGACRTLELLPGVARIALISRSGRILRQAEAPSAESALEIIAVESKFGRWWCARCVVADEVFPIIVRRDETDLTARLRSYGLLELGVPVVKRTASAYMHVEPIVL